ncbi:HigA family addiction module antitoxin [Labrys monachus]|uniref:Addiction module HigA family antidote n=1 Tax=Labrys monachus TaxID=217067 RepID=A0ABU0FJP8_9HYPH|nr:HigA family addiction module antitoxin [Labrys monachus]MDQ0394838.1 addiction module HigA family antidote [Labrys monachus]
MTSKSSIIMKVDVMTEIVATLPPMHPGEMLREEFLVPLGLTAGKVAAAAGVPRTRIERLAKEETGITADTALRLGKVLGTSPEFWLTLQARYDLLTARAAAGRAIDELKSLRAA